MPRRTKACAICRQKRIKCDATMPHCIMCQKYNRQCPGPTDAPLLFIDNSAFPSGKKPKKPKSSKNQVEGYWVASHPSGGERSLTRPGLTDEESSDDELPYELAFDMLTSVSPRYVLNEAFYANFLSFFCAEGRHIPGSVRRTPTWLHGLPPLASTSSKAQAMTKQSLEGKNALVLAFRATTAAFSGMESRNPSLIGYAAGLYGEALRGQGRAISLSQAKGSRDGEMEILGTSIMLGMFESVFATTGTAYAEHIVAAAKMIESILKKTPKPTGLVWDGPPPPGMRGGRGGSRGGMGARGGRGGSPGGSGRPGGGGAGPQPLHTGIFFHIRFQLAFVYLTTTSQRLRTDPVMKNVLENSCAWDFDKLPLMQQVLQPFSHLTGLLYDTDTHPRRSARRSAIYETAREDVKTLWEKYEREGKTQRLRWTNEATGQTEFRDPFTALQYAYFAGCWIMLDLLAPHCREHAASIPIRTSGSRSSSSSPVASPPSSASSTNTSPPSSTTSSSSSPPHSSNAEAFSMPTIEEHSTLILSVAGYLRLRDVGFSYLRLHSPLFLAAMYAPLTEQRSFARMIFEEWKNGSLSGIGCLGLERVYDGTTN